MLLKFFLLFFITFAYAQENTENEEIPEGDGNQPTIDSNSKTWKQSWKSVFDETIHHAIQS